MENISKYNLHKDDLLKNLKYPGILYRHNFFQVIWTQVRFTEDKKQEDVFVHSHQNNGNTVFSLPYFNNKFDISGSETSPHFPDYMEGAVFWLTNWLLKL